MTEPRHIDARGLLCPWPALRLSRAAREMGETGEAIITADDPVAPKELELLCRERGWRIAPEGDDRFRIFFG